MKEMTESLPILILNAGKTMIQTLDHELGAVGLSTAKLWALHSVQVNSPVSSTALAERMNSAKSNITTMVDRLEADGVLVRVPSEHDRRVVEIDVTEHGLDLYEQAAAIVEAVERNIRARISNEEAFRDALVVITKECGMG